MKNSIFNGMMQVRMRSASYILLLCEASNIRTQHYFVECLSQVLFLGTTSLLSVIRLILYCL